MFAPVPIMPGGDPTSGGGVDIIQSEDGEPILAEDGTFILQE